MKTLKIIWGIPELRKKIIFTLAVLALLRVGSAVPNPFIQQGMMDTFFDNAGGATALFGIMSGSAFQQMTLFALGVTPYINASIIIGLLTVVIPRLEEISKDGDAGKKVMEKYTKYLALAFCIIQGTAISYGIRSVYVEGIPTWICIAASAILYAACGMLIVWVGEQITEKGVGNGISLIIFANILSRLPATFSGLMSYGLPWWEWAVIVILFVAIIAFTVVLSLAERRVPIQYAIRQQGRKRYGGQSTFIPIKVNMSGVLPIIFAISITTFPNVVTSFFTRNPSGTWGKVLQWLSTSHPFGAVLYLLLIVFFTFFYSNIQFNVYELCKNMKRDGGFVPGFRPGKPTEDYLRKIVKNINCIGAAALVILAAFPIVLGFILGINGLSIGGSSALIVVGVALETVKQIESEMAFRHYDGFLVKR